MVGKVLDVSVIIAQTPSPTLVALYTVSQTRWTQLTCYSTLTAIQPVWFGSEAIPKPLLLVNRALGMIYYDSTLLSGRKGASVIT